MGGQQKIWNTFRALCVNILLILQEVSLADAFITLKNVNFIFFVLQWPCRLHEGFFSRFQA